MADDEFGRPKTIKVHSEEHGGEVVINESDFNPDIHARADGGKPKARPRVRSGEVAPDVAAKTAGVEAEQNAGVDKARAQAQS